MQTVHHICTRSACASCGSAVAESQEALQVLTPLVPAEPGLTISDRSASPGKMKPVSLTCTGSNMQCCEIVNWSSPATSCSSSTCPLLQSINCTGLEHQILQLLFVRQIFCATRKDYQKVFGMCAGHILKQHCPVAMYKQLATAGAEEALQARYCVL